MNSDKLTFCAIVLAVDGLIQAHAEGRDIDLASQNLERTIIRALKAGRAITPRVGLDYPTAGGSAPLTPESIHAAVLESAKEVVAKEYGIDADELDRRLRSNADRLRVMADWFDNPNESPKVVVDMERYGGLRYTPGFLLRRIAGALEARQPEEGHDHETDGR